MPAPQKMADVLCARALAASPPPAAGDWRAAAGALCRDLRRTVLGCRDGARLLAASPLVGSTEALALVERLMGTLSAGLPPAKVAPAADTLLSYLTGFVLQEQLALGTPVVAVPELAARFPLVAGAVGTSEDDTFTAGVDAILSGFTPHR